MSDIMSRRKKNEGYPRGRSRRRWLFWSVPVLVASALAAGFAMAKRPEKALADSAGIRSVSFSELSSFPYVPPGKENDKVEPRPDPFPREVRDLDGKRVSITGYMVPLHFEGGKIESFYLSRGGFACCYADAPKVTDYIKVSMAPGHFAPMSDLASVSGTLEVGEELNSAGWVETVYRLTAESVQAQVARPPADWADTIICGVAAVGVIILGGSFGINVLKPWLRARHVGLRR